MSLAEEIEELKDNLSVALERIEKLEEAGKYALERIYQKDREIEALRGRLNTAEKWINTHSYKLHP
jgi:chromosome segregation ATPase